MSGNLLDQASDRLATDRHGRHQSGRWRALATVKLYQQARALPANWISVGIGMSGAPTATSPRSRHSTLDAWRGGEGAHARTNQSWWRFALRRPAGGLLAGEQCGAPDKLPEDDRS